MENAYPKTYLLTSMVAAAVAALAWAKRSAVELVMTNQVYLPERSVLAAQAWGIGTGRLDIADAVYLIVGIAVSIFLTLILLPTLQNQSALAKTNPNAGPETAILPLLLIIFVLSPVIIALAVVFVRHK